jgi:hypothetical protein
MHSFGVRSVILWSRADDQRKKYLYEERITLWNAETFEMALELAEREAEKYAGETSRTTNRCGLLQAYWLVEELKLKKQGIEVFSLLRESELAPKAYLKAFFDTGYEHEGGQNAGPPVRLKRRAAARKIWKGRSGKD